MNDDGCPACPPGTCRGYPHLWRRMREHPARWAKVHDRVNAPRLADEPEPAPNPPPSGPPYGVPLGGCCG